MKLNLGCGKNILDGWVNVDCVPGPGVDRVVNLEYVRTRDVSSGLMVNPFSESRGFSPDEMADEILASHLIEHVKDTLGLMASLWDVAKPGCKMTIRCPYGSSDDAWEDPTHVRPYFIGSFYPFAQTYYWRADYGYRGDWQVKKITLAIKKQIVEQIGKNTETMLQWVMVHRNIVQEMVAELVAIKPGREAKRELQEAPEIKLMAV